MEYYAKYLTRAMRAVFIRRNNRFEIECLLDGKIAKAYLPNPGRLWEILLPGREIHLKENLNKRKHIFTVWAARKHDSIVLLHTHYTNVVAQEFINNRLIPELENFEIEGREVNVNNSRIDFLLRSSGGTRLFLEVKSCTLFGRNIAMFPDAVTARGKRHIEALSHIASKEPKTKAGILFLVHTGAVRYFLPDFHTDPQFSKALYDNRQNLIIKAVSVNWDQNLTPRISGNLGIPWQVYEKEAKNRGSYLIIGFLPENITMQIGSLGERLFRKGFYIYVGSAMNSLSRRIKRHLLNRKSKHWHIDLLTPFFKNTTPIPIESSKRLECAIAEKLHSIADATVKHFGSSDCHCPGHLFWMASNPLQRESFINIIIDYRINRLSQWYPDNAQE